MPLASSTHPAGCNGKSASPRGHIARSGPLVGCPVSTYAASAAPSPPPSSLLFSFSPFSALERNGDDGQARCVPSKKKNHHRIPSHPRGTASRPTRDRRGTLCRGDPRRQESILGDGDSQTGRPTIPRPSQCQAGGRARRPRRFDSTESGAAVARRGGEIAILQQLADGQIRSASRTRIPPSREVEQRAMSTTPSPSRSGARRPLGCRARDCLFSAGDRKDVGMSVFSGRRLHRARSQGRADDERARPGPRRTAPLGRGGQQQGGLWTLYVLE